jgi:hypothetical protein
MTTDNEELWYVQMDSGELRELTLDELDEAFNAGLLHENTFVMEVGGTEWQTLADVAGLNDEEPPAPPAPTYASQAYGQAPGPARQLPQLTPQGGSQWPPATSAAMNASAWPPVVAASPAYAPRPAPAAAMPYNIGPQSTAPVVHDLSDLDLNPPFKRRGMGKWVFAAAVLVLGGAGFAANQMKMLPRFAFTAPKVPVEVTAAMTAPRAPEPTPVATTPPAPTPPPATTPSEEKKEEKAEGEKDKEKSGTRSLSEEMKEKLAEADKTRAKERKSKRAARASKASKRSGRGKKGDGGGPFRGGGSASDPLNSKL